MGTWLPGNAWEPPAAPGPPSPILVLDNGIHDFPHFPSQGGWIWGQFFGWGPPPLLLLPALLILVPAPGAWGGSRGALGLPLPLPRGFLLPDFLLDLLQRPLLDGLRGTGMGILGIGDPTGMGQAHRDWGVLERWGFPKGPGLSFPGTFGVFFWDLWAFSKTHRRFLESGGAFQASQVFFWDPLGFFWDLWAFSWDLWAFSGSL